MFGFFYAFMSIVYTNTLESGDKNIFFFKGLRRFIVVPRNRTFSLSSTFRAKSTFLSEVLVVLMLKIGGRTLKDMRFQIENHRCGLDLRPGALMEDIGQCLL